MSANLATLAGWPAALAGLLLLTAGPAQAREHIHIVGSSTVYPFTTVVAEKFGRATSFKTPIIESTGSGGGLKLFCAGAGAAHPDFTNSSRRIKKSEFRQCMENGVTDIIEIKIGYDGIVIANSRRAPRMALTRREIFLALAKDIPSPDGGESPVPNPYRTWRDINPDLPAAAIEVLGPPPTSGTRDAFVELAMEGGCQSFKGLAAMRKTDQRAYQAACHHLREDGAFVETGENDNLIVQKLAATPNAFGIFGFSFLDQNADQVQGARVDGVAPEFENIADGTYPISRPLYLYAKAAHIGVIPGMREFMAELTDEDTWGEEGYLTDRGLIPMPDAERAQFRRATVERLRLDLL
ncbi:MAG: PstS family phosphate ABC transporter substrate-binding protein [Gammaproteobacteria bacterium]|nr:PstS family phosphate ABC transporter substrate-binding protein [Gammaproteobacteria bacterium]